MKQQLKNLILCSLTLLISCSSTRDCPEKANLLPMYGGLKKCDEQIKIDKDFIVDCDKYFKNRKEATLHHINKGWEYFYKDELDTSMMRFNQAWLLDSNNADIYWGFGNILGKQQKFQESLIYFEKSVKLNPGNSKVWLCYATSYGQLFFQSKDVTLLNKSIENLKRSVSIDNTNAVAYGQLAGCYSYFMQKDSAKKYLEITDRLDPNAINPEVRKILTDKRNGL